MKKHLIILILVCLGTVAAKAQTAAADTTIYTKVDENAAFRGGIDGFYNYLGKTTLYPAGPDGKRKQGKVFVTFVVEKDGTLSNFRVLRGISPECDAEAVRVLSASPLWQAGTIAGKPVRQQYTVPLNFALSR